MNSHFRHLVFALAPLLVAGGASCRNFRPPASDPHPIVFQVPPTLDQALGAVNANSSRVTHMQVPRGTLALAGVPLLAANLAYERPRRLRLRAETSLTGPELDLGSNDELFWLWAKRNDPPAVLLARHATFAQSAARQAMPLEPQWVVDALGLAEFDPRFRHEGPFARGPGKIEVRSFVVTPAGDQVKVSVLDDRFGYLTEQHVYSPQGQLLASATLSDHRYYPNYGVSLPRRVGIQIPPAQIALRLDLPEHLINQPTFDAGQLYQPPQIPGYPLVDLTDPGVLAPGGGMRVAPPAPQMAPPAGGYPAGPPRISHLPQVRGFQPLR